MKKYFFLISLFAITYQMFGQSANEMLQNTSVEAQTIQVTHVYKDEPSQNKSISNVQLDNHFIGKSGNIFSVLHSTQKCLTYDNSTNAILATFRADPDEYPSVQSNGSLISAISLNDGETWSTQVSLDPNPDDFAPRYPSGVIYNPSQYTNIDDVYTVVAGPAHIGGTWSYDYFGVAKLNGTNHSYDLQDVEENSVNYFSLSVADDKVHFFGSIFEEGSVENDFEMLHYKGSSNNPDNGFTWETNTIIPDWLHGQGGYDHAKENIWSAWSKDGSIGYMWQIGVTTESVAYGVYQPVLYYTVNQGDTWEPIHLHMEDFGVLVDILPPWLDDQGNEGSVLPNFDFEGFRYREIPGVVDSEGNLHLIAAVYGSTTESVEDDDYGIQITNDKMGGHVFDFIINQEGIFNIVFIDALDNNSPSQHIFSGTKWGHRIQTSKSFDEKKIFVVWNEDISATNGILTQPDIFAWGLDTETLQSTNAVNFTSNDPNSGSFYFDFVSDFSYLDNNFHNIPISTSLTQSEFENQDEWSSITHTYIDGIGFSESDFNNAIPSVLTVSPSNRNVSSEGGTTNFSISSNTNWNTSESETWLSVSPTSGTNSGTISVTYDENSGDLRIGEITISGDNANDVVITVTQAAYVPPFVNVTPNNRDVEYTAATTTFSINSNASWSITDDATWLSVSPNSGSNNSTIVATYSENDGDARVATILIEGEEGTTASCTVTQDAIPPPFINISPSNQNVENSAGNIEYTISSNTDWEINENANWLSVNPTAGSNNQSITVSYDANEADLRIGEFQATDGAGINTTATLTQAYSPIYPPPMNLRVNKVGYAEWDNPLIVVDLPVWFQYDNGINIETIGTIGGGTIEPAVKWDPLQLVGYEGTKITKIKFFVGWFSDSEFKVRVYQGEQGDIIYEQPANNVEAWSWNTITLDEGVVIDTEQSIWVGYHLNHYSGEYPAGASAAIDNPNSDLVKYNESGWRHMQPNLNYSWNLAAFVEDENGKERALPMNNKWTEDKFSHITENNLEVSGAEKINKDPNFEQTELSSFKVYLDNEFVSETTDRNWEYNGLIPGRTYEAGVSALYGDEESQIITKDFHFLPAPRNLFVTNEGEADWEFPTKKAKQVYFSEDFDDGNFSNWELLNNGSTDDTWQVLEEFETGSFDGTSFAMVNSDAAGTGSNMDETIISPIIDAQESQHLFLKWDQNFKNWSNGSTIFVKAFDGQNWITVYEQFEDDPVWPDYDTKIVDITEYNNENLKIAFQYISNAWTWWTAIDNVIIFEGEDIDYNVFLNDEFVTTTNLSNWQYDNLEDGNIYISGVAAKYENGISDTIEYEFTYSSDFYYVGVSPPNRDVPYIEGLTSYTVTSNDSWQATTSADWIHLTSALGEGDGWLDLDYDENTGEARTGIITVEGSNGGDIVQVSLSQDGIEDFLPPRNLRASQYGLSIWDAPLGDLTDLIGYNVYLDGNIYAYTQDQYRQFLTLIPNQTYNAGVQAVYSNQNLSAIIETDFTYTSDSDLLISPEQIFVDESAGSVKFNIFSNTEWTISTETSWITISPANGSYDSEVTLFYLANNDEQRLAEIVVSGEGFDSQLLQLTQAGTTTQETIISITPSYQEVTTIDRFITTQIEISDVADLAEFEFEILFNSSVLHISDVFLKDFILSSGRQIETEILSVNNEYGILEVLVTTSGIGIDGASGSGELIELDWSIVSEENVTIVTGILLKDVILKNTDGNSITHISNDATVEINPSSIQNKFQETIFIKPNPSNGVFKIIGVNINGEFSMQVYNSYGKLIQNEKVYLTNSTELEKDLSHLSKGLYLIKLSNEKLNTRLKLIIE